MPPEGTLQIVRGRGLALVEGDLVDFLAAHFGSESAERPGESDLFLIGKMDLRKDQNPLSLEQPAQFIGMHAAEQVCLGGQDTGADFGLDIRVAEPFGYGGIHDR